MTRHGRVHQRPRTSSNTSASAPGKLQRGPHDRLGHREHPPQVEGSRDHCAATALTHLDHGFGRSAGIQETDRRVVEVGDQQRLGTRVEGECPWLAVQAIVDSTALVVVSISVSDLSSRLVTYGRRAAASTATWSGLMVSGIEVTILESVVLVAGTVTARCSSRVSEPSKTAPPKIGTTTAMTRTSATRAASDVRRSRLRGGAR